MQVRCGQSSAWAKEVLTMFWTTYNSRDLVDWLNLNGIAPKLCDIMKGQVCKVLYSFTR